jgi:hypothetical protein
MCLSRVTQWHPATNRQNELAIPHVIGKLAHLGWIWLRKSSISNARGERCDRERARWSMIASVAANAPLHRRARRNARVGQTEGGEERAGVKRALSVRASASPTGSKRRER